MNSERGALFRGSNPPQGHSVHTTAGDMWRAPGRRPRKKTFGRSCIKNIRQKISIPLRWQKMFARLSKVRRTPWATSRPLHHGSPCYFRGDLYSLTLPDTKRVDRGLILYRDRRTIVGWCVENRRLIISTPLPLR